MTPEEWARKILAAEYRKRGWASEAYGIETEWFVSNTAEASLVAIATALREAEARGLERAEKIALAEAEDWKGAANIRPRDAALTIAAAIRAEKERTPLRYRATVHTDTGVEIWEGEMTVPSAEKERKG